MILKKVRLIDEFLGFDERIKTFWVEKHHFKLPEAKMIDKDSLPELVICNKIEVVTEELRTKFVRIRDTYK